ncbi:MAG: ABC transporter substrate-binding protein [Clostridia bacterium]|nr:ABC transporter substrate-binding protein [Clostridia bacterium]
MFKKFLSLLIVLVLCVTLCSCGYEYQNPELQCKYTRELAGTELNVYNWGEYISDGSEGCMDVNREFERLTGIKVNYTTFESNETMYSQLKNGGVSYDIIIPSDYMIGRLISEDMLEKIDMSRVSNYQYISDKYKGLYFDPAQEYSVPYNVGMVGIIYNSALIDEPQHSWGALWDEKYKNMSLNFNNPRDGFMTAQKLLGFSLNTTNEKEWDMACEKLKAGKSVLQSYVMDEIYGKLETGEAAIGPYYAGDYIVMKEVNEDLEFFYPQEGTNIFVDSVCIPSCVKNYDAALLYINFLLEPEIALANAEYIGYASPHTAVINNPDYHEYLGEEFYNILYPDMEALYPGDSALPENERKVEYYHDLPESVRMHYENLWLDLKLY